MPDTKTNQQAVEVCGKCGLPIESGETNLRFYSLYRAHSENRCLDLLKADARKHAAYALRDGKNVETLAELLTQAQDFMYHSQECVLHGDHDKDDTCDCDLDEFLGRIDEAMAKTWPRNPAALSEQRDGS